ncbi:MAG: hypothetical protein AAF747_05885 [Planctomycetota bacterium]
MIHPAPTSAIDPKLARGTLREIVPETATKAGYIVAAYFNSNYKLHLRPTAEITVQPGAPLIGTIHAEARRMDKVGSGGRYVEPVEGRPRRIQGMVIAIEGDAVVVHGGVPIHCTPTAPGQSATDFAIGDFVTFDVLDGSRFTPAD